MIYYYSPALVSHKKESSIKTSKIYRGIMQVGNHYFRINIMQSTSSLISEHIYHAKVSGTTSCLLYLDIDLNYFKI